MDSEELQKKIQYLRDVDGLSFHQIAQELGISRKQCSKLYSGELKVATSGGKRLDEYRDLIIHWYSQHPSLKAIQVFERLQEREVDIAYSSVTLYTKELRKKKEKCYWPLTFLPGEESQVDWFFLNHPRLGQLSGFVLVLSYSRYLFAHFFPRHTFEFFIEGHLLAFRALGGSTRAYRYDNLRSVVLKRMPLTYNPAFLDFAKHYGFEIRLCNIARGNEKGRVERAIRTIRERFCNIANHHQSLLALNEALYQWTEQKNKSLHRSTEKSPAELLTKDPLKPLPAHAWRNCVVHPQKQPSKTGLMTFDSNRYSVPESLVGEPLSIYSYCDRIEIYSAKGQKVATHPRSFERNQTFLNVAHRSLSRISPEAKRERIFTVMKNLDPDIERFLTERSKSGDDPYFCAHYLFTLIRSYSRQTVLSAIREVLKYKTPSIAAIASVLNRERTNYDDEVLPKKRELLEVDYKPRALEEYENEPE